MGREGGREGGRERGDGRRLRQIHIPASSSLIYPNSPSFPPSLLPSLPPSLPQQNGTAASALIPPGTASPLYSVPPGTAEEEEEEEEGGEGGIDGLGGRSREGRGGKAWGRKGRRKGSSRSHPQTHVFTMRERWRLFLSLWPYTVPLVRREEEGREGGKSGTEQRGRNRLSFIHALPPSLFPSLRSLSIGPNTPCNLAPGPPSASPSTPRRPANLSIPGEICVTRYDPHPYLPLPLPPSLPPVQSEKARKPFYSWGIMSYQVRSPPFPPSLPSLDS